MRIPLAMIALTCVAAPALLLAQDSYGFHPESRLTLGIGFVPNDLSSVKLPCIDFKPRTLEGGALVTQFSSQLVRSSQELKTAVGIDTRVDAHFLVGSAGGSFTFNRHYDFSSDALVYVIRAATEYGRIMADDVQLKPFAAQMLQLGQDDQFRSTCGSEFVEIERRGAMVSAILTITGVDLKTDQTITAGMHGGGGLGPVKASTSLAFRLQLKQAANEGRLTVSTFATGGEGFGGLGDLVQALARKDNAIPAIDSALGVYLKQFTSANSAPIGFDVQSMSVFGYRNQNDIWGMNEARHLADLADRYRSVRDTVDLLTGLLGDAERTAAEEPNLDTTKVHTALVAYQDYLDVLAAAHHTCQQYQKEDKNPCQMPTPRMPLPGMAAFPSPPPAPTVALAVTVNNLTMTQDSAARLWQDILEAQIGALDSAQTLFLQDVLKRGGTSDSAQQAHSTISLRISGTDVRRVTVRYDTTILDSLDLPSATSHADVTLLSVTRTRARPQPGYRGPSVSQDWQSDIRGFMPLIGLLSVAMVGDSVVLLPNHAWATSESHCRYGEALASRTGVSWLYLAVPEPCSIAADSLGRLEQAEVAGGRAGPPRFTLPSGMHSSVGSTGSPLLQWYQTSPPPKEDGEVHFELVPAELNVTVSYGAGFSTTTSLVRWDERRYTVNGFVYVGLRPVVRLVQETQP